MFVTYAVLSMWTFQQSLYEVVEVYGAAEACGDHEEDAPCDCDSNCDCCFTCAHHGHAATISVALDAPCRILSFIEIARPVDLGAMTSTDRSLPLKVPKPLA
jgi:hypothetical protein